MNSDGYTSVCQYEIPLLHKLHQLLPDVNGLICHKGQLFQGHKSSSQFKLIRLVSSRFLQLNTVNFQDPGSMPSCFKYLHPAKNFLQNPNGSHQFSQALGDSGWVGQIWGVLRYLLEGFPFCSSFFFNSSISIWLFVVSQFYFVWL